MILAKLLLSGKPVADPIITLSCSIETLTPGVGEDAGDVLAGLVEADLAVSAHDAVPDQAHMEPSGGFV